MKVKVIQSCPALCDPMDYIVHGILQARILEWVAFPFSRGSSQPRDRTQVSHIAGGLFTSWATREAHRRYNNKENKDIIIMNVRRMVTFREEDRVVTREGHTWSLWKSGHVLLLWTAWLLHVCSLYNYLFRSWDVYIYILTFYGSWYGHFPHEFRGFCICKMSVCTRKVNLLGIQHYWI